MTWLHVKSHYSLGVGTASVPALIERARESDVRALALTDLENLYGHVELHRMSRQSGVHAITGIELREAWVAGKSHGTKRGRVVLLARDGTGYSNLCRIVHARRASQKPALAPLWTLERVGDLSGLFILTDDPQALGRVVRLTAVADVRALVVRPQGVHAEAELLAEAKRHGVRSVASCEGIFMDAMDWELHRLLGAVHLATGIRDDRLTIETSDRRLRSPAAMQALFLDLPEAIVEAERVATSCSFDLVETPQGRRGLADAPSAARAQQELARICKQRLRARFAHKSVPAAYHERLTHELQTIAALGQAPYFLTVGKIVERAERTRVPVMGRGSAVASLVVHLLGASPVDPVAHRLVFERFLHQRRHELPDIDLDVASTMRPELISWVRRRFGSDRVAQVSALQTFQRRSAYREGLKAVGAGRHQIERFFVGYPSDELIDAGHASVPQTLLPESLQRHLPLIERLVGKPRHQSVHPGGVVIAERPLAPLVPLERAARGVWITQYGAGDIQTAGLLKLDLLGNHALDEVQETFQWLQQRNDPFSQELVRGGASAIAPNDAATFTLIERGSTLGCFQLESPAVRRVLRSVPIRSLDDLTAALAIVRPGPASGQAKRAYVRRARGSEPAGYWHAAFRTLLESTYGLLLYEEDIALVLSTLAGLDLSSADQLRELMQARGEDTEWLERVRRGLLRRAVARGFSQSVAELVWREVRRFAAYSFNKAHATSYAWLAYRTAYLKTHAPIEFGCSLLNHHAGSYPKRSIASELVRTGVFLAAPSVQRSEASCSVEQTASGPVIRVGLQQLKHLRSATLASVLRERGRAGRFGDLADFLWRVRPNAREREALIWAGACDELAPLTERGYPWLHAALLVRLAGLSAARPRSTKDEVDPDLLDVLRAELAQLSVPEARGDPEKVALFQRLSRVHHELETLEMHVSDHPVRLLREEANRQGCISTSDLEAHVGQRVRLIAVIAAARKAARPGAGVVQFVTLEDEQGLVDATLVGEPLTRHGDWVTTPGPFLIEGFVAEAHGHLELNVTWLLPFYLRDQPYAGSGSTTS